jgi:trk system potassium uptake protein TrkH
MNIQIIRYILGLVLRIEAALLTIPGFVGLIYNEHEAIVYFSVAAVSFVLGSIISFKKPKDTIFYLKEGSVTTALSWILISLTGCIPFMITGEIPHLADAFFETVSGFTTTGSSILADVEVVSHASIFWRSFTHWIGGMGVLVFLLAVIPLTGGSNINLMKAESPGPSVGKLVPKIRSSASILYQIYLGMTIIQVVLLLLSGMPLFDSLCLTFGTAGTGGFGIKNSSVADYTMIQQWIIGVFMMLFGVNFNFYFFILKKNFKKAAMIEEVRWYAIIIGIATAIISVQIFPLYHSVEKTVRAAFFQVSSIITTTGYSTADFDKWSSNCKFILVLLMFIGACAGSTGGGIKVSRVVLMFKSFLKEITSYIHPRSVKKIHMDGDTVDHFVIRSTMVFFVTYVMIFVFSLFLVTLEGKDLVTSFTAVAACFNNIGPGLGMVGPARNFGCLSDLSKWVLSFDMLAGRLELFPVLLLFNPKIWRGTRLQTQHDLKHR